MFNRSALLTMTDQTAVGLDDSNYINNKGAACYMQERYGEAAAYYHLAAAMGNVQAVSNLGYCYLYGRHTEPDVSLAIAYFKLAADRGNVDAAYKLGDIYGRDKWGVMDAELSVYYYRMAASFVLGSAWEADCGIARNTELQEYPSLCFALGRAFFFDGALMTDLDRAYQFLKHGEAGYKRELNNGNRMYQRSYEALVDLMASKQFDSVRDYYDAFFDGEEEAF